FDASKQRLFCSRDRFGVKPFYFHDNPQFFAFGSEIRQLLTVCPARANRSVVLDFILTSFSDHTQDTFFEGIRKLPAGHNLYFDLSTHHYRIEQFYDIARQPDWEKKSATLAATDYVGLLDDAVNIRLRSDVPV